MAKVTVEELRDAYEEMIDVMDLTEDKKPIEVPEDADEDYLTDKIKKAMEYIDPKIDKFSEDTQVILDSLMEEKEEKPIRKGKAVKKVVEVEEPETKEEVPEEKPAKKGKRPEKAGEPGKPGIIATIAEMIEKSGKKGVTKAEILAELVEQFPNRPEESMKHTINVQIPARINKEKFPLKKLEGGRYAKA